jgi:hypothetical protein
MSDSAAWTGQWVVKRLNDHRMITSMELLSEQRIAIRRKDDLPAIVVGTTSIDCLDGVVAMQILEQKPPIQFLANIARESYIRGSALQLAASRRVGIGGFGDLERSLALPDVATYKNKNAAFIERGLQQHDAVEKIDQLDDWRYTIYRHGEAPLVAVFLFDYELTADSLRKAAQRYWKFTEVVIANPYGTATGQAEEAAKSMGCNIYKWGPFLGRLNKA